MGLDARVYLSPKHLPHDKAALSPVRDPETGEFPFSDERTADRHHEPTVAISRRIGNIALVDEIRSEIALKSGQEDSLILTKVVYSGNHAGDWVAYKQILLLAEEIELLDTKTLGRRSDSLGEFISTMRELITAAQREESAIVF